MYFEVAINDNDKPGGPNKYPRSQGFVIGWLGSKWMQAAAPPTQKAIDDCNALQTDFNAAGLAGLYYMVFRIKNVATCNMILQHSCQYPCSDSAAEILPTRPDCESR